MDENAQLIVKHAPDVRGRPPRLAIPAIVFATEPPDISVVGPICR
jgi:hypothetical protein